MVSTECPFVWANNTAAYLVILLIRSLPRWK